MWQLFKALLLHPSLILIAKILGLFFVACVLVLSRLPQESVLRLEGSGWSQLQLILLGAIFAFATQVYGALAEYFSRRTPPLRALDVLCRETYDTCCRPKAYDPEIRVTAFLPKITLRGKRLVSVSRYVHGAGALGSRIKFKVGEGTVGMAYASNSIVGESNLPDPASNYDFYIQQLCSRCSIRRKLAQKVHVKSRSFLSIPVRYADDKSSAAAIITIDSTSPTSMPNSRQSRVIAIVDGARLLFHRSL